MLAERPFNRVRVTVLDGAGCGLAQNRLAEYLRDKDIYDRKNPANLSRPVTPVNSIFNASQREVLQVPALESLGLRRISGLEHIRSSRRSGNIFVRGAYGRLTPTFAGNGSPEGHQALMGHIVKEPYMLFDQTGFPQELVDLVRDTVKDVVGREVEIVRNMEKVKIDGKETVRFKDDINGEKFINKQGIGDVHVASKDGPGPLVVPIYASSDSLIQIALHEGVVDYETIKRIGLAVRKAVNDKGYRIARIIMRPFEDDPAKKEGPYKRISEHRIDFGVDPDGPTLIDVLKDAGIPIYATGKAASMLNYHGFDLANIFKMKTDEERMKAIVSAIAHHGYSSPSFYFDNLVGTDELYGHPRKSIEYSRHLSMIDAYIAQALDQMDENDLWIITADHGNDSTQENHNNHTNEMTPLLVYSPRIKRPIYLGIRGSFADVAKTIAENYGIADKVKNGTSFLPELLAA